jgi:hypothetical protein
MYGVEKRQQERYPLQIPVSILSTSRLGLTEEKLMTRDISSKGVCINTNELFLQSGEKVHLQMMFAKHKLKETFGSSDKLILDVVGSIIRSVDKGIVIEFDKNYSIFPEIFRTS